MRLYEKLQQATSEEDVKDAYIKALGLKEYQKNLVDIQTKGLQYFLRFGGRDMVFILMKKHFGNQL
ncbi:hypothetical protein QWZ08_16435 [Ferruginibacter paludis]|uniref:hypothetical protein n=1 Tax=Ferruginibacter paludis TaxID=1310417 RepID=UPI0025B2A546|nr:hypothetical protein [Ferruginibacter paludis]MDN3657239.1 hypothetical protein [Ferruginibacter paludis]